MKRLVPLILCLLVVCSLCKCTPAITEGEVYKKEYREEETELRWIPGVISNGKTFDTQMQPYFVHKPERFVIFIKAEVDGEQVTEDFYVSKEVYEAVEVGYMFLYDEERGDLKEEPYTRKKKGSETK